LKPGVNVFSPSLMRRPNKLEPEASIIMFVGKARSLPLEVGLLKVAPFG
jgi:hypothetical protein